MDDDCIFSSMSSISRPADLKLGNYYQLNALTALYLFQWYYSKKNNNRNVNLNWSSTISATK